MKEQKDLIMKQYTIFFNAVFDPDHPSNPYEDYASESKSLAPFYQNVLEKARNIQSDALAVKDEIKDNAEYQSAIIGKINEEKRAIYLIEEFKRREKVIPLLTRVEALYSDMIVLTEAVLELSKHQN